MIGTLEVDDSEKRMNVSSMVGNTSSSLATENKRSYEDEIKINSVKSHNKSKKREGNTKWKIFYHLQDKDDIETTGITKQTIGFKKENRNGISFMYTIRCEPDLGVGKAALRRILYACNSCIKLLELPWDKKEKDCNQKINDVNNNCIYWIIYSH